MDNKKMIETAEKLNNQAIILAKDGSYKEAIACFARAITIENDNELLWYNLGITYRDAGDLIQARNALNSAHQIAPFDIDIIEELAVLLFSMEDFDSAIELCMEGLDLNADNPNLWNTRGASFFNKSDYEEACISFEMAVTLNPYYYDALYNLRDTYEKVGNKTGVDECNSKLKSISKGNGEFYENSLYNN